MAVIRDDNSLLSQTLKEDGVRLQFPEEFADSKSEAYILPYMFRFYKGTIQILPLYQCDPKYREEWEAVLQEANKRFEKWWEDGGCLGNLRARERALAETKDI